MIASTKRSQSSVHGGWFLKYRHSFARARLCHIPKLSTTTKWIAFDIASASPCLTSSIRSWRSDLVSERIQMAAYEGRTVCHSASEISVRITTRITGPPPCDSPLQTGSIGGSGASGGSPLLASTARKRLTKPMYRDCLRASAFSGIEFKSIRTRCVCRFEYASCSMRYKHAWAISSVCSSSLSLTRNKDS